MKRPIQIHIINNKRLKVKKNSTWRNNTKTSKESKSEHQPTDKMKFLFHQLIEHKAQTWCQEVLDNR